jgi:hypothetical protein
LKSGSHNLLEPSGPVQACNGIDLPFILEHEYCEMLAVAMLSALYCSCFLQLLFWDTDISSRFLSWCKILMILVMVYCIRLEVFTVQKILKAKLSRWRVYVFFLMLVPNLLDLPEMKEVAFL